MTISYLYFLSSKLEVVEINSSLLSVSISSNKSNAIADSAFLFNFPICLYVILSIYLHIMVFTILGNMLIILLICNHILNELQNSDHCITQLLSLRFFFFSFWHVSPLVYLINLFIENFFIIFTMC